jgi:hypothetical protein
VLLISKAAQRCLLTACLTDQHWMSALLLLLQGPAGLLWLAAAAAGQGLPGHRLVSRHCCCTRMMSTICEQGQQRTCQ